MATDNEILRLDLEFKPEEHISGGSVQVRVIGDVDFPTALRALRAAGMQGTIESLLASYLAGAFDDDPEMDLTDDLAVEP